LAVCSLSGSRPGFNLQAYTSEDQAQLHAAWPLRNTDGILARTRSKTVSYFLVLGVSQPLWLPNRREIVTTLRGVILRRLAATTSPFPVLRSAPAL